MTAVAKVTLFDGSHPVASYMVPSGSRVEIATDPHRPFRLDTIGVDVLDPPVADPGLADTYRDALVDLVPSIGSVWIWEPLTGSKTKAVVEVTGTRWNGEEWWVGSKRTDEMGRPVGDEHWNELGRWMEACVFLRASDREPVNRWPRAHEEGEVSGMMNEAEVEARDRFETMRRLSEAGGMNGWTQRLMNLMIEVLHEHDVRLGQHDTLENDRARWVEDFKARTGHTGGPIAPWVVRDPESGEPVTLSAEEQIRQMEVEMADMRSALTETLGWRTEVERMREALRDTENARQVVEAALTIATDALTEMAGDDPYHPLDARAANALSQIAELIDEEGSDG